MPNIYLLQDSGDAVELSEQPYNSEDILQRLLAEHPNVLGGDQIGGGRPRRWLLVAREAGIPSEEAGADRWSLDHLFVDQDGTPTLVEVKRSSDTRIWREVVGQMLDYAANATTCWPTTLIRSRFEKSCDATETDPVAALSDFLQMDGAVDEAARFADHFWQTVDTNLRAGRVRLVFVADAIPPELRRIVEFLNVQMNPAEVLAIEVRQFVGPGFKTLVPTVIGQTARAAAKSTTRSAGDGKWDRESFMAELRAKKGKDVADIAEKILDWAQTDRRYVSWGAGTRLGSFYARTNTHSGPYDSFSVWTNGRIYIEFQRLMRCAVFAEEEKRLELARRLSEIPGIEIPPDGISRMPTIELSALDDPARLAGFCDVMSWCVSVINAAEGT
jgi:hypothetical protein